MQRDSEEDAWRAIVENYGERAELDDEPTAEPAGETIAEPQAERTVDPALFRLVVPAPEEPRELSEDPEDGFVPPEPPPLPKLPPDRLAAWAGLFGSPLILLICLVTGFGLPDWAGYLLVAAFIGGFVYLVVKMPRGPADPWDDGARL